MKITPVASAPNAVPEQMRTMTAITQATPLQSLGNQAQPPEMNIQSVSRADAVTEETKPISPQFAELARARRALQKERRALQEEKKVLEGQKQGSDAVPLSRLKSEPLKVLLESGVTYDQLTQAILANQSNPEIFSLKAEVQALKEGFDKKLEERSQQERKQYLSARHKEALAIAAEGDDFALVRASGRIPDAIRLLERVYDESGELLPVKDALSLIEAELFKDAEKIIGIEKLQSKLTPPSSPAVQQRSQGMRTLTNKDTAQVPMSRKEKAIAAFYRR